MTKRSILTFVSVSLCALSHAAAQGRQNQQQVQLPDGKGKEIVQVMCTQCHAANMIANSGGYTHQGWKDLFSSMISMRGEQADVVAAYLAEHYPVKPRPEAVLIPGSA
ncbi:MAG TPA: hypothetical protein VFI62_16605, partial [Burkholderiales bacterium]|nr:hypothetical protein [Burkholderiales bacterium]